MIGGYQTEDELNSLYEETKQNWQFLHWDTFYLLVVLLNSSYSRVGRGFSKWQPQQLFLPTVFDSLEDSVSVVSEHKQPVCIEFIPGSSTESKNHLPYR